jgi:hypothetical protein
MQYHPISSNSIYQKRSEKVAEAENPTREQSNYKLKKEKL